MIVKAVVHVHSDWSYDGNWSLSKLAHFFGKIGYRLVLTNEHDRTFDDDRWIEYRKACSDASTEHVLLLPGIEYSDVNNMVHVLVWGVAPFLGKDQMTESLLRRVNELNGICVLAHPSRKDAWQHIDLSWMSLFHGMEAWNRKFDGIAPSRDAIRLLNANVKCIPFIGTDFHEVNQLFPLSMMIRINGILSEDTVIEALRNGQCYSLALGISETRFRNGALATFAIAMESIRRALAKRLKPILMQLR